MLSNTGVVFPGQGSQSLGMLADVASVYPQVHQTFEEANDILGYDLWSLIQTGPLEVLNQTAKTQPALLATAYALWRILQLETPFTPVALAGHSLGEYTALVCAEAIPFGVALKLVAARGQFMQEAVPHESGAMAAIVGLDDASVSELCLEAKEGQEILTPANYNSVGQVVIAGHKAAVLRAIQLAKSKQAKLATLIPVSVPSHCALMRPAADRLATLLNAIAISDPLLPVINNVDVLAYKDADMIREGLERQLYQPVRWVETIQSFAETGIERIIECGPGKVLTGLNKRINKNMQYQSIGDLDNLNACLTQERGGTRNVG